MNIKGKFITLRAIEMSDEELLRNMFNDPYIEKMVVGWAYPVSKMQQENYMNAHIQINEMKILRLIIEDKNKKAVGTIILSDIDQKNGNASIGIKILDSESRSKGIGTDAIMALLRYSFEELRLNRINTTFLDYNKPSQATFIKCGFKIEGCMRQNIYKNGSYHDLLFAGILRNEYDKLIEQNHYWD